MNLQDFPNYIIPILILTFFVFKYIKQKKIKSEIPEMMKSGAIIVDVRGADEFHQGANPKSINIPLNQLENRIHELNKNKMIILCCASGGRSGMALNILRQHGYANIINAGAWQNTLT